MIHNKEEPPTSTQKIRENLVFGDEFIKSRTNAINYGTGFRSLDLDYISKLNNEIRPLEEATAGR
jgi:hypothetical protein